MYIAVLRWYGGFFVSIAVTDAETKLHTGSSATPPSARAEHCTVRRGRGGMGGSVLTREAGSGQAMRDLQSTTLIKYRFHMRSENGSGVK